MNLQRIAARIARIAGQTVKSAIESDNEGFTKAVQEIIDNHFVDRDEDIQLVKVEVKGNRGSLFLSGGALGGPWRPLNFDTSQEYADFLKALPNTVESLEGPVR